jgi:hypothetical protein
VVVALVAVRTFRQTAVAVVAVVLSQSRLIPSFPALLTPMP